MTTATKARKISRAHKDSGPKRDHFAEITAKFVQMIEDGQASGSEWAIPWKRLGLMLPRNALTGKRYKGINVLALGFAAADAEAPAIFATFKQWGELGCQVQKGEKATQGVYWALVPAKDKDGQPKRDPATGELLKRMVPNGFAVFHVDQVADRADETAEDGKVTSHAGSRQAILDRHLPTIEESPELRHQWAEKVLGAVPAVVNFGGDQAYYSPRNDAISLPERRQFATTDGLYSTWAHELTHWTGHATRLNREGITSSDGMEGQRYAFEELVAELGSVFMCQTLGVSVEPRPDHAHYLAHWVALLKDDGRALYRAAAAAERAMAFLLDAAGVEVAD